MTAPSGKDNSVSLLRHLVAAFKFDKSKADEVRGTRPPRLAPRVPEWQDPFALIAWL